MNVSCKFRDARRELVARHGEAARNTARAPQPVPRAFTLVELLVTIAIIAILAAALLGASGAAFESARRSRTKTLITKLDALLMEKYQSFTTRRVDINPVHVQQIENTLANMVSGGAISHRQSTLMKGQMLADLRLLAIRELMKLEMPDRWSDITGELSSSNPPVPIVTNNPYPWVLADRPAVCKTYGRRFLSVENKVANDSNVDTSAILSNQSAECLYLTIMLACGDGESPDLFSEQDIADTDGDGAPEFIDGWGQPIQFVRWPSGYSLSNIMSLDADTDHDPLDPFRRDAANVQRPSLSLYPALTRTHVDSILQRNSRNPPVSAFRLVPLIFSIGADGDSDVFVSIASTVELDPYTDKYLLNSNATRMAIVNDGEGDGEGWIDNITNHNLEN